MVDCDTVCPWGPSALSTSTAELAKDASRPSIDASPQEHLSMLKCAQAHTHEEQGVSGIHHNPILKSAAYTVQFLPFVASYSLTGHD